MSDKDQDSAWAWFTAQMDKSEAAAFWPLFALLHLLLLYWAMRYTADPAYRSIVDGSLMPVHEMGHPVMSVLGNFMGALGGSLFQWGLPLIVTLSFLKRGDLYGTAVGLFLLGVALSASYQYMDSAFQMEKYPDMMFVSLGEGEASHDWQHIFGQLGLYRGYTAVALLFRIGGLLFIWSGVLGGALVLWHLVRKQFRA
jgi:hypothetical protein